jgi:hypothetical protein
VPSSTSNSNARLPGGRSGRILLAAVAVAIGLGASYEGFLRLRGFAPSITDDAEVWSLVRSNVRRNDAAEVVLIGASRSQADFDSDLFATLFNGVKPRQLAIAGGSPLPVLGDLAQDESFKGLVICDVMPIYFFAGLDWNGGIGAEYTAHARKDRAWDRAATRFRLFFESRLALRSPDANPSPGKLLEFVGLRPAERQHTLIDADRYTHMNRRAEEVSLDGIAALARETEAMTPVGSDQLARDLAAINDAVHRIRARGGRVVFSVLPVSGPRRDAEERRFPRAEFWEKFVSAIDAPSIHFADYPELAGFTCHDGSHLTIRETPAFTGQFVRILKTKLGLHDLHPQVRPGHG